MRTGFAAIVCIALSGALHAQNGATVVTELPPAPTGKGSSIGANPAPTGKGSSVGSNPAPTRKRTSIGADSSAVGSTSHTVGASSTAVGGNSNTVGGNSTSTTGQRTSIDGRTSNRGGPALGRRTPAPAPSMSPLDRLFSGPAAAPNSEVFTGKWATQTAMHEENAEDGCKIFTRPAHEIIFGPRSGNRIR